MIQLFRRPYLRPGEAAPYYTSLLSHQLQEWISGNPPRSRWNWNLNKLERELSRLQLTGEKIDPSYSEIQQGVLRQIRLIEEDASASKRLRVAARRLKQVLSRHSK